MVDIKGMILKNESMAEAVNQVMQKIQQGEDDFDKVEEWRQQL